MVSVPSKGSKQMAHSVELSVNEEVILEEAGVDIDRQHNTQQQ